MPKQERDLFNANPPGWGGRIVESILLVDDNKPAAQSLAQLLAQDGYEVHVAHDGETALEMAERLDPDVAILDVNLPGIDGYEVARSIRKKNPSTLLIALTGYYGRREDKVKGRTVGFDHYLTRPILVTEIEKLFSAPK